MHLVGDVLSNHKGSKPLLSFELVPPLKGQNIRALFDIIEGLQEFSPSFINITTHSSKYVELKKTKKRPGTIGIAASIKNRYNIITVPHILCRGFTKHATENTLIELNYLGIDNVLLLRGDETNKEVFERSEQKNHNSTTLELIQQVNQLKEGKLLGGELPDFRLNFNYGIGGYPEKHPDAKNLREDIEHTKEKVDLGAAYIITQFFFDNDHFFNYYEQCRKAHIKVPIIPGIKLISRKRQLELLPKIFTITIPKKLQERILNSKNDDEVKQIGVDWCIEQCRALEKFAVKCLHFYTMSRIGNLRKVLEKIS